MEEEDPLILAGREHFRHHRLAEARECFETLLAREPRHVQAHLWLGLCYGSEGEQARAI